MTEDSAAFSSDDDNETEEGLYRVGFLLRDYQVFHEEHLNGHRNQVTNSCDK